MKKFILSLVLLLGIFALTGCVNKKPLTSDEFYSKMKEKHFTLTDATNQFEGQDYMEKVFVAQNPSSTYQIEFLQTTTEQDAIEVYANNKNNFEEALGNVVKNKLDVDLKGVQKFRATSNGKFMALTRINNTMIYVNSYENYSKEISNILKELGY